MSEKILNEQDRFSNSWLKLKKYYEDRLASLRANNDGDLDEKATATLRGRIREVKALLALGEDKPFVDENAMFKD